MSSLDFIAICYCSVNICLSNCNLLFIFCLVLSKLSALEVRLESQPDLPPEPSFANHVVPDCSLAAVKSHLLVLHLLKAHSGLLTSTISLKPRQNLRNSVFTSFFHLTK